MGQVIGHSILEMDEPEHHPTAGSCSRRSAARRWRRGSASSSAASSTSTSTRSSTDGARRSRARAHVPVPGRRHRTHARPARRRPADVPPPRRRDDQRRLRLRPRDRARRKQLYDYFCAIIADRRAHPSDDVISVLAQAELEGTRLTDDEICSFLRLLLPAGAETTYRSSSNLLYGLLTNPDQLDALRADRELMPQAIEEGLRWEPPLLGDHAHRDARHRGRRRADPAGSIVAVNIGSANHDERYWDTPRSSTSSGRRGSTSRSRGDRTCVSACTSHAWRPGVAHAVVRPAPEPALRPRRRAAARSPASSSAPRRPCPSCGTRN